MKKRGLGIFGKVFLYTLLFLTISTTITAVFFAGQFMTAYETDQKQQLIDSYLPLTHEIEGKSTYEIKEIARDFHEKNASFEFSVQTNKGEIIYETSAFSSASMVNGTSDKFFNFVVPLPHNMILYMANPSSSFALYTGLFTKAAIALFILLIVSIIATAIFASRIVNPIKRLALDARKMSNLEFNAKFTSVPFTRSDEIGELSGNIYKMYEALKTTISKLEIEIEHEKEMEENQRYFFSAASHELKTPMAAVTAMLEGMLENVVDYHEYPHYLRQCLKMMAMHNKLISEILEIVRLTDGKIQVHYEDVRLNSVVASVLTSFQALIEADEQNIIVTIPNGLLCRVDIHVLNRILSNIFMNAVQNTPKHGEIHIWSEVQDENTTRLCILNTDAHIDGELISKLFEPFYRMDRARSKNQGRSGLGLTIVKKTLDRMGIPFSLENTDAGVLFWLHLPLAKN
ncbi:sensor histidine kinase [Dictyobacter formicarum]|uniref:histidine kinase n=1 Tax=Dictyobacter formicarum TaxID=2778368 RepID=A0ABQ3VV69_9CHLR|nr:HAMP domain-containing sensor histidine kinase [Dictyobacter formicarum]GHO89453.1 sensor protein VanSB [Dictyobacter formicarum]